MQNVRNAVVPEERKKHRKRKRKEKVVATLGTSFELSWPVIFILVTALEGVLIYLMGIIHALLALVAREHAVVWGPF